MGDYIFRKSLIIGLMILFVGASVTPSISRNIAGLNEGMKESIIESRGNRDILFYDDFNDNIKDYSKWTEIYTEGTWEEINQRTEFKVNECPPPNYERHEGIERSDFSVSLSSSQPVIVSSDMISNIGSIGWVGYLYLEITDGTNWIWARFHRFQLATHFMDSNDATYTYLSTYKPDSSWSNEIQVFSDRYIVKMAGDSSGEIYDTIFTPDSPLRVCIYIICAGEKPWLFQRSGFDNVKVTIDKQKSNRETKVDLIEGCIKKSLVDENEYITYTGPLYIENIVRLALKKIMSLFN